MDEFLYNVKNLQETMKMMKVNVELLQEGISIHVENELKRFKSEIYKIKNEMKKDDVK
jgi:hypothetical protein